MFLAPCNTVAVASTESVNPDEILGRVTALGNDYTRSGDIPRYAATRRTHSLEAHLDRVLQGRASKPKWIETLRESGHDMANDTVTEYILPSSQRRKLERHPASRARLEVATEIFGYSSRLLRAPGLFYRRELSDDHFFDPSEQLFSHMLLGGGRVLRGMHPLTLHFLERQTLLDELYDEVAGNEWPIFVADPEDPPPLETVHEAPDFPHYLSLWHDFYHSLRHRSWPLEQRRSLPLMDLAVREASQGEPFINAVRVNILSGPEPTHFRTYGFYGSLFLAIAEESLKKQHHKPQTTAFILRFYNRIRKVFKDHPDFAEIKARFSQVLMARHVTHKESHSNGAAQYLYDD